jgi:subtilisin family serine protease
MGLPRHRAFASRAGAVAAALLVMAVGFGPIGSIHAQVPPKDQRAKKAPLPKGPVQPLRKGAGGNPVLAPGRALVPNPPGIAPRGQALGPNALPQNARIPINTNPNIKSLSKGPNTAVTPDPRANPLGKGPANAKSLTPNAAKSLSPNAAKSLNPNAANTKAANIGPGSRFGNSPGNRALGSNQPGGRALGGPGSRGFTNRDPRLRAVNAATPQMRQVQRFTHRNEIFAIRAQMPRYPLPGERNFTGVPPAGETRFVTTEMVCQWGPDMSPQAIEEIARRHDLVVVSMHQSALTGGTLVRFRIGGNRGTAAVVRAMEAERIVSQPNYVYLLGQNAEAPAAEPAAAQSGAGTAEQQYVVNKLRLAEVHKIATGKGVLVAVIDSQIDDAHPELSKGIAEQFDGVGQPDKPHTHGTGMAGAIVSQDRLMGVAPGVRALAVHAFATGTQQSPQATTQSIVAGLEWALGKGARIINMSFAGPYDPMLALALKKASEKGAILIAAVGNAGPKSPPLYPAADPHVIGVTAIDENDKLYKGSNVGKQVAVAAPGVDVMVPAPAGTYQLTTGTSVAAAHVSGVAALLLERHPQADATLILEVLTASATRLGTNKRDDKVGWGLIDPLAALSELDARLADVKVAAPATAPAPTQAAIPARTTTTGPAPAAASSRSTLPRPGIYAPKQ